MATASTIPKSRMTWHVRGTWSAREDRKPSAVWLGILWVGMIAGFGVDFPGYLRKNPPAPVLVHIHAAVFTVWMLLLTAQVLLVLRDRVALHRKLGVFAVGWACLMAVMGPVAFISIVAQQAKLHGPFPYPFISVHVADIGGFLVLLAYGIALRKNPAAHKRMMILSTVALADPGFSRFSGYFLPEPTSVFPWFIEVFYGNVLLIVLMLAWDWGRGRLIRSHVIGSVSLLAALYLASLMYFWPPWKALTRQWVAVWAKHFA
jgi:hypothetical protein